jgi:hypothetical protein
MRALAIIVFTASTAAASTLHHPVEVTDNGHSTITLILTSRSIEGREVVEPVEIPAGMTATALTVAIDGETLHSFVADRKVARGQYDSTVALMKDPALLEYRDARHAVLRVFPVRRGAPAKVTIELTATSLAHANELTHLDVQVSLLADPYHQPVRAPDPDDLYAEYWPRHPE